MTVTTTVDSGYAWVILLASVGCNYVNGVLVYFVGVIHVELLIKFQDDVTTTAWVGAVYSSLQMLGAPVAGWLVHRYSCRVSVVLGGVCLLVGFTVSAFATSVTQLVFTYGLIAGLGLGLCYSPTLMIVTFYFDRFRALASGVSVSGMAIGILTGSLTTQRMIDVYGLQGAFLLIAAFAFHCSVFGMLYRPTHHEGKGGRREKFPKLLQEPDEKTFKGKSPLDIVIFIPNGNSEAVSHSDSDATKPSDKSALNLNVERCENDCVKYSESAVFIPKEKCDAVSEKVAKGIEIEHGNLQCRTNSESETDASAESEQLLESKERTDEDSNKKIFNQKPYLSNKDQRMSDSNDKTSNTYVQEEADSKNVLEKPYQPSGVHSSQKELDKIQILEAEASSEKKQSLFVSNLSAKFNSMLPLLRNLAFLSHCMNYLCAAINMSGVYLHLPEYSRTHGTTSHEAATLFVGSGIFSLVSRLGSGLLLTSSRVNSFALSVGLMALCGAATSLFPLYSDTYLGQMVFASIFGLSTGGFFTLINVLTMELVDVTSLPAAYGVLIFMMGIGWVAGPPMAGMIVDSGGTYEHSFIFLGIAMFASAAFDLLAKVLHSRKSKQGEAISSFHDVSSDALKDH
ncbi:monocarboxylate transporter 12-like [Littorina saxatilis]|uniref:Uncharacterized protein n=1 Tax=Littorina saxatilis TaxID=31220 RepID=A0AAN9G3L6_9CAEN